MSCPLKGMVFDLREINFVYKGEVGNKNSYKGVLHRLIKVAKCLADLLHTIFTYAKVT